MVFSSMAYGVLDTARPDHGASPIPPRPSTSTSRHGLIAHRRYTHFVPHSSPRVGGVSPG